MNRNHANRPTKLTAADHARMARAVAQGDRRRRNAQARERLARLTVAAVALALPFILFYNFN